MDESNGERTCEKREREESNVEDGGDDLFLLLIMCYPSDVILLLV